MDQYWNWVSTTFVPRIRANNWYNDALPANLSGKYLTMILRLIMSSFDLGYNQ